MRYALPIAFLAATTLFGSDEQIRKIAKEKHVTITSIENDKKVPYLVAPIGLPGGVYTIAGNPQHKLFFNNNIYTARVDAVPGQPGVFASKVIHNKGELEKVNYFKNGGWHTIALHTDELQRDNSTIRRYVSCSPSQPVYQISANTFKKVPSFNRGNADGDATCIGYRGGDFMVVLEQRLDKGNVRYEIGEFVHKSGSRTVSVPVKRIGNKLEFNCDGAESYCGPRQTLFQKIIPGQLR